MDGEQKLFHLSKKTVADLEKLAAEAEVERGEDLFVKGGPIASPRHRHYTIWNRICSGISMNRMRENSKEIHMFEALSPERKSIRQRCTSGT